MATSPRRRLFACFNPRPALLPGESGQKTGQTRRYQVSIHARHCCRANRTVYTEASTNSTFQSTPGIAAGRIMLKNQAAQTLASFNPRPALLPGESKLAYKAAREHLFQSTPGIAAGRIRAQGLHGHR